MKSDLKNPNMDFQTVECASEVIIRQPSEKIHTKAYPRRYLILILFILFSAANNIQMIQYSIIQNIMTRYYNVSTLWISCTAMVFMALYIILLYPVCYIMNKGNLRNVCLLSAILTCIGSWIKGFSVSPDRFVVAMVGQTVIACCQITVLATPPNLASQWFPSNEIATATAFGSLGVPLGIAIFSYVMPTLVQNHDSIDDIGQDMKPVIWGVAIFSTCVGAAMLIFFKNEPKLPPTEAKALQKMYRNEHPHVLWITIKRIVKNKSFLLLFNAHGFNVGVLNALPVVINQLCVPYFQNAEEFAGEVTMVFVLAGIIGCPLFGIILDKTKKFKELSLALYICCLLGAVSLSLSFFYASKVAAFISAAVLGITMLSYMTVGFEVCAEITYPEPESITIAILTAANQIYGIILIVIMDTLINQFGDMAAHICVIIVLLVGTILTAINKVQKNRYEAAKNWTQNSKMQLSDEMYGTNCYM